MPDGVYEFVGGPADGQLLSIPSELVQSGWAYIDCQLPPEPYWLAPLDRPAVLLPPLRRHWYRLRPGRAVYDRCSVLPV